MHHPDLRTVADTVGFHAGRDPGQVAIICEDRQLTYGQLHSESNRTAHAIRAAGLGAGARVAFLGKDCEDYYDVVFGCAKSGTVLVPVNWRLAADEVSHILRDSGSELLFVGEQFAGMVEPLAGSLPRLRSVVALDRPGAPSSNRYGAGLRAWKASQPDSDISSDAGPDDPVVQLYTSGTTGQPKGVVLAHRSFFAVRDALAAGGLDWIDWRPGDRNLLAVPGFHIGGLWWAIQAFDAGVTNVAMPIFMAAQALDLIRRHAITITAMVPAMLQMVLAEPNVDRGDFTSLRKVIYGGSPISAALLARCLDVLDCELAQIYGLTETGNTAVCLPPADHLPGSALLKAAGRPYPGFAAKVIDSDGKPLPPNEIGEVCLFTPARMLEYWGRPEATRETLVDGWVHTGDAGYLDDAGYVFICDRIKDMIIVAGENVYPAEIENALCQHPAVAEAAVIGVPDGRWGEAIRAVVVVAAARQATQRELSVFLMNRIASFKLPTQYEFVERLPRNPSGKILRRELRARHWQGMERKVN
jgi:acyl-CoA synthetase (AMP-forming)/AMP-acid ligase II